MSKPIQVRYGASVEVIVELDDELATTASLYVGLEGQTPVIVKTATFIDGIADLSPSKEDTEVPIDEYKYQINVNYSDGTLDKFPLTECWDDLPDFHVLEALDETEAEVS